MKVSKQKSGGFSLIELMVVFVIISILAGMVMKLVQLTGNKQSEAETVAKLERIAQSLEEFKATYGRYPPVAMYPGNDGRMYQPVIYEYALYWTQEPPSGATGGIYPNLAASLKNQNRNGNNSWSANGSGVVYTFGLMSYLFPRFASHAENSPYQFVGSSNANGNGLPDGGQDYKDSDAYVLNQWDNSNNRKGLVADIPRDVDASRRVLPYIGASLDANGRVADYGNVVKQSGGRIGEDPSPNRLPDGHHGTEHKDASSGKLYRNGYITVLDGWIRPIFYSSPPPYDTYKLWSAGANGMSGDDDDVSVGQD
jgi:prepilin-type N-terminal cleavage/methylation domain